MRKIQQYIYIYIYWIETNFDMGLLSLGLVSPKFIGVCFAQPHVINIYKIAFVSLDLLDLDPNKF